jgi:hypothetical protein
MKFACLLVTVFFCSLSHSQNAGQKPCSAPEASQFDFWVGDWIATWGDTLHGTNHIEKMFGNCTVHENFSDPNTNFVGQSWSVYNANYKQWQQTWVDNQGGYISLTGGMKGDSLILTTAERTVPVKVSATGKLMSRMVYYNIKPDAFDWSWEASTDGGQSWKQNWLIHYHRKN